MKTYTCPICKIKIEAPPYSYVRCRRCSCVMVESSPNSLNKARRKEILAKVGKCSKEMGK
jgi:hypothetical protein